MTTSDTAKARTGQYAEMILKRLRDYLSIRFDHAGRINPMLKAIKEDLMYHEMESVRSCLEGEKIYGTKRRAVADVLLDDDDKKRRGLMSPTDQTSIQVELVSHVREESTQATRGQLRIHNLKAFYASINPDLDDLMDLIETWLWWDITDAAELTRYEQKLLIIQRIRQGKLTPELRKRYAMLINPAAMAEEAVEGDAQASAATDEEALRYEIAQLERIVEQWAYRQQYEHGYMFVLKRDEVTGPGQGEMIHRIAEQIREYDRIDQMEALNDDTRHAYASDLRVAPENVTKPALLELLQENLIKTEREMLSLADHTQRLGAPYRYKVRQLEQMEKMLGDLKTQLKDMLNPPPAA